MSSLLIIFYQNCEICTELSNGIFWDFCKDFVLPILLAFGAGYTAYYIFIKETKRDKLKEDAQKNQERLDKLLYFSVLIKGVLDAAITQKKYLKVFIREVKKNDVDNHIMTCVNLNDLKRITETLNLETYLLAYTNQYSNDRKTTVAEFKRIIASVDFFYDIFIQIHDTLEKAQKYDYERKTKFQEIFAASWNITGDLMIKLARVDHDLHNKFSELIKEYDTHFKGDTYDITFYYDYYFVPFNVLCVENLDPTKVIHKEIRDLSVLTRDGKQLYEIIKNENHVTKDIFIQDFKTICKTLIELRNDSKHLIADF